MPIHEQLEIAGNYRSVAVVSRNGGPFPGIQVGDVVAYEFELDPAFTPRPGERQIVRPFILLDVGVQITNPVWWTGADATSWYVDLLSVSEIDGMITIRDLYIDVIVPTDGRHSRMLDLEEFADAIDDGNVSLADALDGLRRWQAFLDRYIYTERMPSREWSDFPPVAARPLMNLSSLSPSKIATGRK